MRIVRGIVQCSVLVVAATMLWASPVSAGVEVTEEGSGLHCGSIGDCNFEAHSESATVITAHLNTGVEVVISACNEEFQGFLGEVGEGLVSQQIYSGPGCPNKPCEALFQGANDGDPWPIHVREDGFTEFDMHIVFCLTPVGGGSEFLCEVELDVVDMGDHQYELVADDQVCDGPLPPFGVRSFEMDGHWLLEAFFGPFELSQ